MRIFGPEHSAAILSQERLVFKLYKTPTREKILSVKRLETCPVCARSCILWF